MTSIQNGIIIPGVTPVSKLFPNSEGCINWYDGTIISRKGGLYTIRFDDGECEVWDSFETGCGMLHYQSQHASNILDIAFDELDEILEACNDIKCVKMKERVSVWAEEVKDAMIDVEAV